MSSGDETTPQTTQSEGIEEENAEVQWVVLEDMAPVCSCGLSSGIVVGATVTTMFVYYLSPVLVRSAAEVGHASSSPPTIQAFTLLPEENVCFSKDCAFMARVLRKFINQQEDPCRDFYGYTCGRYEIPSGDLRTALEKQFRDAIAAAVNSDFPSKGQSPIQKTAALLRACYNVRLSQLTDSTDLTDFMKSHDIQLIENDVRDPTPKLFVLSLYYDVHVMFKAQLSSNTLNSKKQRLISLAYNEDYRKWLVISASQSRAFRERYYKDHLVVAGVVDYDRIRQRIWSIEGKARNVLDRIRDSPDDTKEKTIAELGRPAFVTTRWLDLMQKYAHPGYTNEDTVRASNKSLYYFYEVQGSALSYSELNLIAAWETVRQLASFVNHKISKKLRHHYNVRCKSMSVDNLGFSNAYFLYSMAPWGVEAARNLTSKVRNEFLRRATAATLLANKEKVLKQIATMAITVGFSQALDSAAKLDDFWKEFPDVEYNKFLGVWLDVHRKRAHFLLNHPEYYIFSSIPIRTYYARSRHLLLVPPSMLTTYFFGKDSLASLNFAGLGHFVGTGLAETVAIPARSNCPRSRVASLLGLQAAYAAYVRTALQDSARLPLMNLASQRLFFLAACLKTCAMRTARGRQNSELCNAVLRNMAAFAKAYNCSMGTKMNPKQKCKPW